MKYQWKIGFIIPAAIALLLTAACGGGGGTASNGISISITSQRDRIWAGESVELTVNARGTEIEWPSATEVGDNFKIIDNRAFYTPPSPDFPKIERICEFTVTAKADKSKKSTVRITVFLDTTYRGINNRKQIIGQFSDAVDNVTAFLKVGDTYAPIVSNVTGSTYALAINNYGEILGYHAGLDSYFLRGENGGIYYLDDYQDPDPDITYYTYYTGINDSGQLSGYVVDDYYGYASSFIRTGDNFDFIVPPADDYFACSYDDVETCGTFFMGINNLDVTVGHFIDSDGFYRGFMYDYYNDEFILIDPIGRTDTFVMGINDYGEYGEAVGYFHDFDYGYFAFGFVFMIDGGNKLFEIDYPYAVDPPGFGTFLYGINDDGVVVGRFFDREKFQGLEGFYWELI